MEVMEMNLGKSAWKKKADLVLRRLAAVCPHWHNILTTDLFRNELYITLDRTAEKLIRLEIVHQSTIDSPNVHDAITLKDEVFVLYQNENSEYDFDVYNRNYLAGTKDFIGSRLVSPRLMTACSVSNCVYVLNGYYGDKVVRFTKKDKHTYTSSTFFRACLEPDGLAVDANGNIFLYQQPNSVQEAKVVVYDANGVVQRDMKLNSTMKWIYEIVPMPNGNLLIASAKDGHDNRTKLTEMDMNGTVLRQYQSSLSVPAKVRLVGPSGRVLIFESLDQFELLDKELNPLNAMGPQLDEDKSWSYSDIHYDGERNELVTVLTDDTAAQPSPILTVLQFREE